MAPISLSPPPSENGTAHPSRLTVVNGSPMPPTFEFPDSLRMPKPSVLRESITHTAIVRPRFGRSTSVAFEGQRSVHEYLQFLKNERFRYMPHDGSNWDRVLRWADNIGGVVLLSHGVLNDFMLNSEDATRLVCDSCLNLIQLGTKHVEVLLKVFSVFHKMAFALSVFLRQHRLIKSTPDVRRELTHAFQKFAHLTCDVRAYCSTKYWGTASADFADFDAYIAIGSASFYSHIESVSVSMWASSKHCAHYNIHKIRDFLSPQDSVVKTIMSNQLYSGFKRAEFTCEWFVPHLRKFTRNGHGSKKVLLITGGACTGKTVLARWIYEKLQESVDDDPYDVITYSVDTDVKYTTSPLSLIKSLLIQLLDRKIGREGLLSHVHKAMEMAQRGSPASEVETALWDALEASLDDHKLMFLIDGLDQLSGVRIGNPPALEVLERITKSKGNVRAIMFSRLVSNAALKHCQEHMALEDYQEANGDMQHYIEDFVQHHPKLRKLHEDERKSIIQKHAEIANGSFLWAELQLHSVQHEDSPSAILKACQAAPKNLDAALDHLIVSLDSKRPETKQVLSWILAAERPLALKEVKALLEVDLERCTYRPFSGDVEKTVGDVCGPLIVIRDGLVCLRHPSIRERLLSTTSVSNKTAKLVIDLREAHTELTIRSMAYVGIHLQHDDVDPHAELFDVIEMAEEFSRHQLFEYAARYWLNHFRSSSLYDKSADKMHLSTAFKMSFPNSVCLALVEGTCLARQYIACEAEKLQNLAYKIRTALFGEHSAAVLQSLLLELRLGRKFKDAHTLSRYSYDAWRISRHSCSLVVAQALAVAFVEYSSSLEISEHEEFRAQREEVLEYLVEVFRHASDESMEIHYATILAQFYIEIGCVEKAVVIYRRLYRLRLKVCGHLHEETRSLFEILVVHLKQLSLCKEVLELYLEYHRHCEHTLVITDERRIKSTIGIIQIYEERQEFFKAEATLVRFWKSVSVAMASARITELKIDFALKYSEFLYRQSRKEESEVILRGVWSEIQCYSYESRFESAMIKRVQKIAKYFERLESFSMSRSIYQSLYEHYESQEQRTSTECITIVKSLAETITKSHYYSKTTSTSTSTSTTSTTTIEYKEEKTLMEVFESCMQSTEISSTTISICQAFCSTYMHEERYEEACEIYGRVISKVWASIERIEITEIPEHLTEEIFELAFSFAVCHFKLLHIETAQTIYFNLFRALICTRHVENKHFLLCKIKLIIEFFEEIYKFERVIEIYRELFVWMPICFGKTDFETITILMSFARICVRMKLYHEAVTACFHIYSCFHIAHGCLHRDGFEATVLLCELYEIQCKWEMAGEVYGFLWRTFVRFGAEYQLDVEIISRIYERYMFILEHKEMAEYSLLLQVSQEYYQCTLRYFRNHHEHTIKATMAYAHICERREEHRELSIGLYQKVIEFCKETKSEFSSTTLHTCNTRVAAMYAFSTKGIKKAVSIYREQFESSSKTERTSSETITVLRSLVSTYKKESTSESITNASETLKSHAFEIFKHESRSSELIESARSMAEIYKESCLTEQAETLIQEMRSKLVEQVKTSVTSHTHCETNSYVFLASFRECMSEVASFSSAVAELRTEMMLYESYFKATNTQTDYSLIVKSGCELYFHLEKKAECRSEFVKVEKELIEYFRKYIHLSRTIKESVWNLFFRLYLKHTSEAHYENVVIKQATATVLNYTRTGKFGEAYELVLLVDRFIHLNGGFHCEFYIRTAFDLAKYLVGVGTNKSGNAKQYNAMIDLSRVILQEALVGLDKVDIDLCELRQLLVDVVSELSHQKKYQDLERILQTLWHTRTIRNNISSSPLVLYLGRSLIQTFACLNKFSDAIHLCHHIRYNLAYIRGTIDRSTLEFTVLLSALYTEQKRYRDVMELHDDILCRLGRAESAPGLDALHVAHTHTELLEMAFKRHGKLDKDPQHYHDVFSTLDERFGDEKAWKEKRPQLDKWTPGVKEGQTMGCWFRPARFEWDVEGEESVWEQKWREELVTRRVSGKVWHSGERNGENRSNGFTNGHGNGYVHANASASANGNGIGNGMDLDPTKPKDGRIPRSVA